LSVALSSAATGQSFVLRETNNSRLTKTSPARATRRLNLCETWPPFPRSVDDGIRDATR
jgi:hypothetical protein